MTEFSDRATQNFKVKVKKKKTGEIIWYPFCCKVKRKFTVRHIVMVHIVALFTVWLIKKILEI